MAAPGTRARVSWILFDWAAQPYHTLITAFIFAPYFATGLFADSVAGQATWGYLQAATALAIAFAAPTIGGYADRTGRLKPALVALSAFYVAAVLSLWLATPGAIVIAMVGVGIAGFAIEVAAVLTNAMLPRLARPGRLGALSGTAWAVGFVGGLVSLAITLALLSPAAGGTVTLAGLAPLFGLDAADGGPARATGVLSAVWYVVFALPLFLFVPWETARAPAAVTDTGTIRETLRDLWERPGLLRFLVARLFYQDALLATFAFGGIYGASLFGWGTTELGLFGILLTITGALGAWAGGRLDDRLGAKPTVVGAIVLCLAALALIGVLEPADTSGGLFATTGERMFLVGGTLVGIAAGPLQAASRTYLARSAPEDRLGAYFGLYAFSGKAIAFTGPLLVGLATDLTGSQRAGVLPIAVLFVIGFVLLLTAPSDRRE